MKITRAYKTELDPNNKQITYFVGSCGMARFVYNWALDYWIKGGIINVLRLQGFFVSKRSAAYPGKPLASATGKQGKRRFVLRTRI